jgi:hypothetical protein
MLHSGRPRPYPQNTRLGWKSLPGTNALAYYGNPLITAVIGFMIQAPGACQLSQTSQPNRPYINKFIIILILR